MRRADMSYALYTGAQKLFRANDEFIIFPMKREMLLHIFAAIAKLIFLNVTLAIIWIFLVGDFANDQKFIIGTLIIAPFLWIGTYFIIRHDFPYLRTWARIVITIVLPVPSLLLLPFVPITVLSVLFFISYILGGPGGF